MIELAIAIVAFGIGFGAGVLWILSMDFVEDDEDGDWWDY